MTTLGACALLAVIVAALIGNHIVKQPSTADKWPSLADDMIYEMRAKYLTRKQILNAMDYANDHRRYVRECAKMASRGVIPLASVRSRPDLWGACNWRWFVKPEE